MRKIHRKIIIVVAFIAVVAVVVVASIFVPPIAMLGVGLGYAVGVTFAKDISHWAFSRKKKPEEEPESESEDEVIDIHDFAPDIPEFMLDESFMEKKEGPQKEFHEKAPRIPKRKRNRPT